MTASCPRCPSDEAKVRIVSDGLPANTEVTVDGKLLPVTRIEWICDYGGSELVLHVFDADIDIDALNARFVGPDDSP